MIVLNNSGTNQIAVTLKENTTVSVPDYLFEAVAKDSNVKVIIDPLPVLSSSDRWDVVEIDGTLFKSIQYTYQITEKTTSKIVERGLLNAINEPRTSGWKSFVQYDNQDNEERGTI